MKNYYFLLNFHNFNVMMHCRDPCIMCQLYINRNWKKKINGFITIDQCILNPI